MKEINRTDLTYRKLKAMVPEANGTVSAKKLKDAEVLLKENVDGAEITVYKNGYLTYTRMDGSGCPRTTVWSVSRCSELLFPVNFSDEERTEAWDCSALAHEVAYREIDGRLTKLHIVKEEAYLDMPWWLPVTVICEERLDRNSESRGEYHREFSIDDVFENADGGKSGGIWNTALASDQISDWMEAQDKAETDKRNHEILMEGLSSLTDIQRKTVALYFSNPGITERAIAKELGVNQSTVHRNLSSAIKKLKKYF